MPCIACGEPTSSTRCPECQPTPSVDRRGSARARGYDTTWDKLSRRARRLQPFCADCGSTTDLTTDHKPEAWRRKAECKPIRLADVDVVCRPCNSRRGSSRDGSERAETHGTGPLASVPDLGGKPQSRSHTEAAS